MKTLITVGLALCALAVNGQELYQAKEVNVSVFGTYSNPEHQLKEVFKTNARHGDFGAGIGVQYWLTEYFGGQLDAVIPNADDIKGGLFDYVSLSVVARYPVKAFAPYVIAGAGHNFTDRAEEFSSHLGVGIEYRFTKRIGAFVESRYLWQSAERSDELQSRAGITLRF